jgi:hypothetical protein
VSRCSSNGRNGTWHWQLRSKGSLHEQTKYKTE